MAMQSPLSTQYVTVAPSTRSWWYSIIMFVFVWFPAAFFVLGGTIGLIAGIASLLGSVGAALGALVAVGVAVFLVFAAHRNQTVRRQQRGMIILAYLENAVRLNLPLESFLLAAEQSETGLIRRGLSRLRLVLARGGSVAEAVELGTPDVPEEVVKSIAAAEQVGRLQATLTRELRRAHRARPTLGEDNTPFYRFYLFMLIFMLFAVGSFMMIFVMPKFREIFKDFHTELPTATQMFMNIADLFSEPLFILPFLAIGLFIVLGTIGRMLQNVFMPFLPALFPPSARDWFFWHLPIGRRMQMDRALGGVLEHIADAVRAGLPLPDAVQSSLSLRMNYRVAVRLEKWRAAMIGGMAPSEAARAAALPALLSGLLEPADHSRSYATNDARADLFEFLSRYYRDRFSRTLVVIRSVAEPVAVLIMGLLVGSFMYAMFSPIVALITSVEGNAVQGNGVL